MANEIFDRNVVVYEAESWIGTPYDAHMRKPIKGKRGGCDCGNWMGEVYRTTGIFDAGDIENLPPAWFLQNTPGCDDRYLMRVLRHMEEITRRVAGPVELPEPGDLVLVKTYHAVRFSHGAIVASWPKVIHCMGLGGVHLADVSMHPLFLNRPMKFFSPWSKKK